MKKLITILLILALSLAGCTVTNVNTQKGGETVTPSDTSAISDDGSTAEVSVNMPAKDESFTERDLSGEYDIEKAATITFSDTIMVEGSGVSVSGGVCRISAEGVYILSGQSDDARIEVNADEKAKIQLVLNGVNLTNGTGSVIYIKEAKKVFITLAQGTENFLTDTASYTADGNEDGVIFSKADMTINGSGRLTISANYAHGIVSKDDLVICGGTYDVTSVKSGFSGKDALRIASGTFTVKAGTDGFKSSNSDDEEKGILLIYGGNFDVHSEGDAFCASKSLMVSDGTFDITTSTGSASAEHKEGRDFDKGGFGRKDDKSNNTSSDNSVSAKAFKADSEILLSGGTFKSDSLDDCIHSNGVVKISGGTFTLKAGDDAIHADTSLSVSDCEMNIESCYEGMEAVNITIESGNISINADDDGINANGEERQAEGVFTISGGYLNVCAYGDGLDSNGYIYVKGGTVLVSGPENNGNGALDYGAKGVITGGTVIICGSSGMAQNFGSSSTQCTVLCNFSQQNAGTRISCVDGGGNIIISFAPTHSYSSVVISSPSMEIGKKYSIYTGGECETDGNGFADEGQLSGGESLGEITLTKTASTFGKAGNR